MKKILTTSALALTMACGMAFAALDAKPAAGGVSQQMPNSSSSPELVTYFQFKNLPDGASYQVTSSGGDNTGVLTSSMIYYTNLRHGTYQMKMDDGSVACSFAVNYTNVTPTKSNPAGQGLSVQAVTPGSGYSCNVSNSGDFNPLITVSPSE